METRTTLASASTTAFLEGADPTPRILAVEPAGGASVAVFTRGDTGAVERAEVSFSPWLLAVRSEPWRAIRPAPTVEQLDGDNAFRYLVRFPSWASLQDAIRGARDSGEQVFTVSSMVDQYLVLSGRTLFKRMVFEDLRHLQLDIETTGLDATDPAGRIIIATLRLQNGREWTIAHRSEEAILADLTAKVQQLDPDVIEGHNLYNFDLPFIAARAARWSVPLAWGRDGSPLRIGDREQRVKVGPLSLPYRPAYVHGRHIVDTYQQIQRYDVGGRLTSYGLKQSVDALGLTRSDREFVRGEEIAAIWKSDPDRLVRYALDDVRDVDLLTQLTVPTEFYQTQLLPRTFQHVAVTGPGTKINDLMVRAYLAQRASIPQAGQARDYPGGHAELLHTGVFSPVVKCDVESLYPSIMLRERITSSRDTLGTYLPMLEELTRRRLHAKEMARKTSGQEQGVWEGLQASFKVLINSFYGYLGFGAGLFNDFDAARAVTISGQQLIKRTVASLEATGSVAIEVDTDGVYFVPPTGVTTPEQERAYIERIGRDLPEGIRLAHDGRFMAMLSLRLKNYALMAHDGSLTLKGSALRSRRLERCFRAFLTDAARAFMTDDRHDARQRYFDLAEQIKARRLGIAQISQWAMVHDDTVASQPRLKRLLERQPQAVRAGDRVQIYEREDGELALAEEYALDENVPYLLRRLHDTAKRFEELFASRSEFAAFFPPVTARTDVEAAKAQQASAQLPLF